MMLTRSRGYHDHGRRSVDHGQLDSVGHEMDSDLVSVSTGGSMSDYASDQEEDIELELGRDKMRHYSVVSDTIVGKVRYE